MTRSYRSPSGRYEILGRRASDNTANAQRFLDRGEAERFVRRMLGGDGDALSLRSFAVSEGFSAGKNMIADISDKIARGEIKIVRARSTTTDPVEEEKPEKPKGNDKPKPPPKPKPKDDKTAELLVIVKDEDGKPIKDAEVNATGLGKEKTNKDGKADFGKVKPGEYDVEAKKPGHAKKKNKPEGSHKKEKVNVSDGRKTTVNLIQHPICANVAFFEGPKGARTKYSGFDHKTNIPKRKPYWDPVPKRGKLSLSGKEKRDGGRWVSLGVGKEVELEINFDFRKTECIPCIENSTFEVIPADIAELVTAKVSAKKAAFKIKGKKAGEASLKVICDGEDIGWFHIWCAQEVTLKLDVIGLKTTKVGSAAYDAAKIKEDLNEVFQQALIKFDMKDLGEVDLSADTTLPAKEAKGYNGASKWLATDAQINHLFDVMDALHESADKLLKKRTADKPRKNAYRLYLYIPASSGSILGVARDIGSNVCFAFKPNSDTMRNTCVHELGHCLGLEHPLHNDKKDQFAKHNLKSLNKKAPDYDKTNTEPASSKRARSANVMAKDPTNLMGYWHDRPNRKPLRYHQWKATSRS